MASSAQAIQNKGVQMPSNSQSKNDQELGWWDSFHILDGEQIRHGFNFGMGSAVAVGLVGGAFAAIKAAWVWNTTTAGAQAGFAVAGPVGALAGGIIGAGAGTLV